MSSKAQKRRNKRMAKAATQNTQDRSGAQTIALRAVSKRQSMKPTPERKARGVWVDGKDAQPDVDLAEDLAGTLFHARQISDRQLEAARQFQEIRAAYIAEFAVPGYKSCLAGGVGGHDEGDGNPEAFRAYRKITKPLNREQLTALERGLDLSPCDAGRVTVWKLRDALDAISA